MAVLGHQVAAAVVALAAVAALVAEAVAAAERAAVVVAPVVPEPQAVATLLPVGAVAVPVAAVPDEPEAGSTFEKRTVAKAEGILSST